LYLDNNELTGTIPEWTGTSMITQLQLNNNQLTGQIPASIFDLPQILVLDLSNNVLTGPPIFPNTSNTNITSIDYSGNQLTGAIPTLTYVESLSCLSLTFNNLSGVIPGLPVSLQYLLLAGNNLYGNLPSSLSNLTALVSLDVSYNSLSGQIPQSIFSGWKTLKL